MKNIILLLSILFVLSACSSKTEPTADHVESVPYEESLTEDISATPEDTVENIDEANQKELMEEEPAENKEVYEDNSLQNNNSDAQKISNGKIRYDNIRAMEIIMENELLDRKASEAESKGK